MGRLYLYAAIALVLTGAFLGARSHYIGVGIERQQQADAKALVKLQLEADEKTAELQTKADLAEHAHDQELKDLRQYVVDNPLHGRLSNCPRTATLPHSSPANPVNAGTSPAPADVLNLPKADSGGLDQLRLLDLLARRGDAVSASLREYQSR